MPRQFGERLIKRQLLDHGHRTVDCIDYPSTGQSVHHTMRRPTPRPPTSPTNAGHPRRVSRVHYSTEGEERTSVQVPH
nr:hypothetical protein [Mycobacterium uberis]